MAEVALVAAHSHNFRDLTGQRFGVSVVLGYAGKNRHGQVQWRCQCQCGNEHIKLTHTLRKRRGQKSCGCIKTGGVLPEGEGAFNSLLLNYKGGAAHRGLAWELSKELFRELTKQRCHYCGIEPHQVWGGKAHQRYNGVYTYNGVDRLDNDLGYLPDNCVPCCGECNIAKGARSYEQFMEWVMRLIYFQKE